MTIILPIFVFMFGACVGSFLNVVAWRMPRGESIVFPGSRCPKCGRAIKWYDNIPILSWLLLKARCRYCRESISIRYPVIEALSGLLLLGLYAAYFIFDLRAAAGSFFVSWPVFCLHGILLCGLLACSIIDIEYWQVPLEICWAVSLVGAVAASVIHDPAWIPHVSPATGAMAVGAGIGLVVANIMQHRGMIQPSFIDAAPQKEEDTRDESKSVAFTKADGVNPRVEVLRELVFLSPALFGALAALFLAGDIDVIESAWRNLLASSTAGPYIHGFLASLYGFLIGGLWIWGTRIIGTIMFGKEAMGLGDVHIMSAVGAVAGWAVPSMAFFIAPLFGLAWALFLALRKGQRELPYGPWLSVASITALVFYDDFAGLFDAYCRFVGLR